MRTLAHSIIATAAEAAGLPAGRVTTQSAKDNITLPRPRLEVQYLPESYLRTGRVLCRQRDGASTPPVQRTRRELYAVRLPVVAHVLADDDAWLDAFTPAFVAALPPGVNDARGLWVAVRVQRAEFAGYAEKRVGAAAVNVFTKRSRLFTIDFTWRVATEEVVRLLTDITITPRMGQGG